MTDRIHEIINGIKDKHGFEFSETDILAIEMGVDILRVFGEDTEPRVTTVITQAAILIGLRNKFPDVPVHYAFLYVN